MIELMFQFGGDMILVTVNGNKIMFGNTAYGNQLSDISGVKLSREGSMEEHPDLINNPFWEDEVRKRFRLHIKSLKSERKKAEYIIEDLKKHGYILKRTQEAGHRPKIINGSD